MKATAKQQLAINAIVNGGNWNGTIYTKYQGKYHFVLSEYVDGVYYGIDHVAKEFAKAKNDGCKVTLLIEDEKGRDKIRLRKELDAGLQKIKQHIKEYEKKIKNEPDEFIRQLLEDEKLLIEQKLNIDEEFALRKTWKSRFCANSMIAGIKTFKERYNLDVIFCKKTESADKMLDIFYKAIDTYFNSEKE